MSLLIKRFWHPLLSILIFAVSASPSFAQQGPSWAKIYGTNGSASEVLPTPDGGYIASGWKRSSGGGIFDTDMWIVKLDASGNPTSQRTYGGGGRDEIYAFQLTSDGGYIAAGLSTSFGASGHAPLVLKFDSLGNIQWQKTYIVGGRDWANAIKQTSDGGYVIAGATDPTFSGPTTAAVIKLDASGNIQWQKIYGAGLNCEQAQDILQTPDGGYIVVAFTGNGNSSFPGCWTGAGGYDIWLLKLDSSGNIQWQKTYGGSGNDVGNAIRATTDGGWIVAGYTNSFGAGGNDAWILKLNSDGTVAWQKAYGGTGEDLAYYAEQTSDGGYIVSGSTTTFAETGSDLWVFKLDAAGNVVWQRGYDSGSPGELARKVHQAADGGYIVAGYDDIGCTQCNFTVLKLRPDGSIDASCPTAIGKVTSASSQNTTAVVLNAPASSTPGPFNASATNVTITDTSAQTNTICSAPGAPPTWTQKFPAESPPARSGGAMAYDSARQQVVLFGGSSPTPGTLGDTWVWEGNAWTQEFPATSPPARSAPAMDYDSARNEVVLFGGGIATMELNDTWVWDGTNWTQRFPSSSPPPRNVVGGAYDAARQQFVLFGGVQSHPFFMLYGDTWVWDGSNWTQKFPAHSPSPRGVRAMAYDTARQQVVLFGGSPGIGVPSADTWVWDGADWTQKSPSIHPSERYDSGLAYDTARQQILLFGGVGPPCAGRCFNYLDDTWVWDGTNWTQKFPAAKPSARATHNMASDSAHAQVVLFGGSTDTIAFTDTWVWGSLTTPIGPPPSITSILPSSGIQGQTIANFTVNGNNFDPAAVLFLSGTGITVNSYSSRTLTQIVASVAIANAAATGLRDVGVVNPDSQQARLSRSFSLLTPSAAIIPPTPVGVTNNPQQLASEPVMTGNGNYIFQRTDLVIPGRGLPLVFQRTYNTLDNYSGPLGGNWTHSYNISLFESQTGDVFTKWGDGHGETFALIGTSYVPQPGVFSTLVKNADGTFVLTQKNQTKYVFSATGKLASIQDKNGNAILLTYNTSGNLSRITDTVGRNLNLSYDESNRITEITDPLSRAVSFAYDGSGNVATSTDPAGGVTTYAYDFNHRVTSITLPNSQILLQNTYDSTGRVISQTGGRGFTTTLAYGTTNPGDTTITDARGNRTFHTYDSSLRIVRITNKAGFTSFTYDGNNDRTGVTKQNGKTTSFSYDSQGNITSITDPLSNAIAFTYDGKNNLLTATNAKVKTTTFSYDTNGNLKTIQDALSNTTTFSYDSSGQLTTKTDARGNTTAFSYDSFGNLTRITDAIGHSTTLGYDGIGRLVSITDPNGHTASANYDALSRLVKITDPLSNQTKFDYDPVGNLLKITDANGSATSYVYDAANNLVTVTDALGHVTQYAYDGNNNRVTFNNAKGSATNYAYDTLNRLTNITDPLSFVTSYGYDPVGNVLATTDAKAQTNQFTYDALNRLLSIAYADGKNVAYSYDANGNRTSMIDSHGTTTYSYDDLDRLTSVTHPGGNVVSYAYDAVGNRQSVGYPDGKLARYVYDPANRLAGVTDWLGRNTTYTYDAASNLTGTSYPNQAALAFAYDAANRLLQVRNSYRGSADLPANPVTSFTYVLDLVGNRLQVTDGSGKRMSYGYDALYQLVSVTAGTKVTRFTYDAVGNRLILTAPGTSINYTYDAADRLLMAGTSTFTYDANGNETSKTLTATGQPLVYQYDAANRLISFQGGTTSNSFSYDGDGNRISQSVGTGTYNYLNDVATALPIVLQESGPDGNISYAYGLGLISESSPTFDFFYHYDGLGSVMGLTDSAGKLAGRYLYDAWGQADLSAPLPQLGTKNKFRFTGEALDPGTQLYYLRARYYDPSVGRFLSRDPFSGFPLRPLTRNRFIYALNQPTSLTDPRGLAAAQRGVSFRDLPPPGNRSELFLATGLYQTSSLSNANSTPAVAPPPPASQSPTPSPKRQVCVAIELDHPAWVDVLLDLIDLITLRPGDVDPFDPLSPFVIYQCGPEYVT